MPIGTSTYICIRCPVIQIKSVRLARPLSHDPWVATLTVVLLQRRMKLHLIAYHARMPAIHQRIDFPAAPIGTTHSALRPPIISATQLPLARLLVSLCPTCTSQNETLQQRVTHFLAGSFHRRPAESIPLPVATNEPHHLPLVAATMHHRATHPPPW